MGHLVPPPVAASQTEPVITVLVLIQKPITPVRGIMDVLIITIQIAAHIVQTAVTTGVPPPVILIASVPKQP